jgi:hypothetical protein
MSATDPVRSSRKFCAALLLAGICGSVLPGSTAAGEQTHQLRGLFCNTEGQLDEALGHMSRNVAPRAAAELTNDEEVFCTYVDLLHYIVEQPRIIGEIPAEVPLLKYEGELVGVIVGDRIRPVSPPARVFFILRDRLPDAVTEQRV